MEKRNKGIDRLTKREKELYYKIALILVQMGDPDGDDVFEEDLDELVYLLLKRRKS